MFLEAIILHNKGFSRKEIKFQPTTFDKRFLSYSNKRRESKVVKQWSELKVLHAKSTYPYANKTLTSSKMAMIVGAAAPFVVRAIESKPVMGVNTPSIVANILLSVLSCWEWWCLTEAFARAAIRDVTSLSDTINTFLTYSIDHHIRVLNAKHHIHDDAISEKSLDKNLLLNLNDHQNIVGLFSTYKLLSAWVKKEIRSLEVLLQTLLLIQLFVTGTYFSMSFLNSDAITLNITCYVLVESLFCLLMILGSFQACVGVNQIDKKFRLKCIEVCALLYFDNEETGLSDSSARAFRGISTYLDRAKVFEAKVFGIHLSKQLVAKIMISFAAATGSALLRSEIS